MTAATARDERLIAAELVGVEIAGADFVAGPATRDAAAQSIDGLSNAFAEPTVRLLPARSPLAAPRTTVPSETMVPPV